jgi:hypothetical protein
MTTTQINNNNNNNNNNNKQVSKQACKKARVPDNTFSATRLRNESGR